MTDLVTYQAPSLAAIDPSELAGMSITLDRVKNPSGGGIAFEVPNGTDSPDSLKEIVGVIVDHHAASTLWLTSETGGGGKPHAYSADGVNQVVTQEARELCEKKGWPQPSTLLATCPYNAWPNDGGFDPSLIKPHAGGKANQNQRRLYVLPSGEMLPFVVTVTPAGLWKFDDYMLKRITLKGKKLSHVLTRITLEKVTKGGNTYSTPVFSLAGELSPEDATAIDAFVPIIKQLTRRDEVIVSASDAASIPVIDASPVATREDDGLAAFDKAFDATEVTEVV